MRSSWTAFYGATPVLFWFTIVGIVVAKPVKMHKATVEVEELHRLKAHQGEVLDAVFLRDGKLVSAGADGTLRLWDVDSGDCIQVIAQGQHELTKILAAPDGRRLLTFSSSGDISVWQLPQPKRPWGPEQAAGPPDTPTAGDNRTAWASETEDGQTEWLLLGFAGPVKPTAIHVHETYNPGAVAKVTAYNSEGEEVILWEGKDPLSPEDRKGIAKLPVQVDINVNRVKLYLNSPAVAGWNEIDAVGLMDREGGLHWATEAAASSTYAERSRRTMRPQVHREPPPSYSIPAKAIQLSYVDNTAEGKQSFGGSGHAVRFERSNDASRVVAIEVFGSRYGYPEPPDEEFHVYLLDEQRQVIQDLVYPYAIFQRGGDRWYVLGVDSVEVPKVFYVALYFNAHRTKGIYVGKDSDVAESHSLVGTLENGFESVKKKYDWMVRVHLLPTNDNGRAESPLGGTDETPSIE